MFYQPLKMIVAILLVGQPPVEPGKSSRIETKRNDDRVIVIRFSESMFQPEQGSKVDEVSDVNRTVLGASVRGKSRTVGAIHVDLMPDSNDGSFKVSFQGASYSRTVTYNGPVQIQNSGSTHFQCDKRVLFNWEKGFHARPAQAIAQTQLQNDRITTARRGLVGRVIRNIATRRAERSLGEATVVTNRDSERDLAAQFDLAIDPQLAEVNKRLETARRIAAIFGRVTESDYYVRSNSRYLEICLTDLEKAKAKSVVLPDQKVADAPIEVWIHSSLFDAKLRDVIKANALAEYVVERLSPHTKPGEKIGVPGTKIKSIDVVVVDGWLIFAIQPQRPLVELVAATDGSAS